MDVKVSFQDLLLQIDEKLTELNLNLGKKTLQSFCNRITSENFLQYKRELADLRSMLITLYNNVETDEEDDMYDKYLQHITKLQRQLVSQMKNLRNDNLLKKRNNFFKKPLSNDKKFIVLYDDINYNPTYARKISDNDVSCSCCNKIINNYISSQDQQKKNIVYICNHCNKYYKIKDT